MNQRMGGYRRRARSPDLLQVISGLPGEEIVLSGFRDLERGERRSCEALLVLVARSRLVRAGFSFLDHPDFDVMAAAPESLLYRVLCDRDPGSAYEKYNSLKRRLDSFIRGLEQRRRRAPG